MEQKNKQKEESPITWLFSQVGDKKPYFVMSILLAFLSVISGIMPYFVVAKIVSNLVCGEKDFKVYMMLGVWMTVLFLGKVVFHSISTCLSHGATFAILANIRKKCTDKLAKMPLGDVLAYQAGSLKSTIVERVDSIETTLAHIVPEFTSNLLSPIIVIVAIFALNWKLGIAALVTLPIGMVCFMLMMTADYEKHFNRCTEANKNLNDVSVEYINGIEVIKAFGKAEQSYEKFVNAAKEGANSYVDWMANCNVYMTLAMCIAPATMVTLLPVGAVMYMHGTVNAITLFTVLIYGVAIIEPFIQVMSYEDDLANMKLIVKEVRTILDAKEMERPEVLGKNCQPVDYSVRFEKVEFGYQDEKVLHGIDLEVKDGEFLALVGPSGSGKSTIARLLAGLWDVEKGSIKIGGVDVRKLPLAYTADHIAYVSQDNYLFNRSIRDNIRMGKTDGNATDEEVEKVAKLSGCHDFIMSLENGYDTIVGSGGGHLSGGERQRIAIARAMLKDAEIVILDEATAYTDPESEAVIQASVARLVKGKTLIVIAHRLSTIIDADNICCINDGKVEEMGTHKELLERNGLYKKMWDSHILVRDTVKEEAE